MLSWWGGQLSLFFTHKSTHTQLLLHPHLLLLKLLSGQSSRENTKLSGCMNNWIICCQGVLLSSRLCCINRYDALWAFVRLKMEIILRNCTTAGKFAFLNLYWEVNIWLQYPEILKSNVIWPHKTCSCLLTWSACNWIQRDQREKKALMLLHLVFLTGEW